VNSFHKLYLYLNTPLDGHNLMSKTRKEKLLEELMQMIEEAENLLINTPENVTVGEYQQAIERIKYLRETLKNVSKM